METERPSASYTVDVSVIEAQGFARTGLLISVRCFLPSRESTLPPILSPCDICISRSESRRNQLLLSDGPQKVGGC